MTTRRCLSGPRSAASPPRPDVPRCNPLTITRSSGPMPGLDYPQVVLQAAQLHLAALHDVLSCSPSAETSSADRCRWRARSTSNARCGSPKGIRTRTNMPGRQVFVLVLEHAADADACPCCGRSCCRRSPGCPREESRLRWPGRSRSGILQALCSRPGLNLPSRGQHKVADTGAGLLVDVEADVNRIGRDHGREHGRIAARLNEVSLPDPRLADAAVDGRDDLGELQVQFGLGHARPWPMRSRP